MKKYLVIVFFLISIISFSQSVCIIGNFPFIHKVEKSGIINAQLQINLITTKDYDWSFGLNLSCLNFRNQLSNRNNQLKATITIENSIIEIGPSLGLQIIGDLGFYHEKSSNGLAFGFGIVLDRMLFEKTQVLINIKENMLIKNFNYLNLGIGIRRYI